MNRPLRALIGLLILCCTAAAAKTNAVPMIYQPLFPMTAKPGSSGFTLTIYGTGFAPGIIVTWNGQTRITSVVSSTEVQAEINASDVAQAGTNSVNVINPKPGGGISNTIFFPVQIPAPTAVFARTSGLPAVSGVDLAGDFNNDGFQDVLVASQNSNGFFIDAYYGNGDGTFKPVFPNHAVLPTTAMIAGVFKSQYLDVATLDGIGNAEIFSSYNGSFFLPEQTMRAGMAGLAEGDFNKDGKLDLFVPGGRGYGHVYLGNGNGTFTMASGEVPAGGNGVAVGDFNGDGNLDLAAAAGYYGVYIFLGKGDGTFSDGGGYRTANPATVLSVADVNGDGPLDIVTNGGVLLGNGDGTFTEGTGFNISATSNPLIGDFNGDGELDAVIGTYLVLGNGDGTFQTPIQVFNDSASTIVAGDFNGDGKMDLVGTYLYLQAPVSVSPTVLNFGSQNVRTKSRPQSITVLNAGASSIAIKEIGIKGADVDDFSHTDNCPASLAVGASCQIAVVFTPKVGGPLEATLNLNYAGVGSPQTVALSGTGAVSTVSLEPSHLKFGLAEYGEPSPPQTATLTNTGSVAVGISQISTALPFIVESSNCPASLAVNTSCHIGVSFRPLGAGYAEKTLFVTDTAQGSPQKVTLSGEGTVMEISPSNINFGNEEVDTKSSPAPVTLSNTNPNAVDISGIGFGGKDPGDFSQTNNCGSSLAGFSSCTIQVTFTPQAKGSRSATLEVQDNGGGSPQEMSLLGTGT
jgi:hypothetical protein